MKYNGILKWPRCGGILVGLLLGCVCTWSEPSVCADSPGIDFAQEKKPAAGDRAKGRFASFTAVEVKETLVPAPLSKQKANVNLGQKLDEILPRKLKEVFTNVKAVPAKAEFTSQAERTLQITATIREIQLPNANGKVWGANTGTAKLVLNVDFRDGATGEIIASPFFSSAPAVRAEDDGPSRVGDEMCVSVVRQLLAYLGTGKM